MHAYGSTPSTIGVNPDRTAARRAQPGIRGFGSRGPYAACPHRCRQASPTVTMTIPLPPQFEHMALSAVLPLPLQTGQVFSPVCSDPGAASSPGFFVVAAGMSGEEGLLMKSPGSIH